MTRSSPSLKYCETHCSRERRAKYKKRGRERESKKLTTKSCVAGARILMEVDLPTGSGSSIRSAKLLSPRGPAFLVSFPPVFLKPGKELSNHYALLLQKSLFFNFHVFCLLLLPPSGSTPRELCSFVLDAFGPPVCALVPIYDRFRRSQGNKRQSEAREHPRPELFVLTVSLSDAA